MPPKRIPILLVLLCAATPLIVAQTPPANSQPPIVLTIKDAIARAHQYSPQFQLAVTEAGIVREDRVQARAGLLPSVNYETQYLYTEGNGTPTGRFIANNAVHEYLAQGNAHQEIGLARIAEFQRSGAAEALAQAKQEIAARGLVVTVVQDYYGLIVAERKYASAQQAADEAQRFLKISQELERGGEVAHSDVIKAQLQTMQRQRDLQDAQLAMTKARLGLAVLLFPNFNQDFTIVDDLGAATPLPSRDEAARMASANNPQLRAALASLHFADRDVLVAWAGHLPTLSFDYWYGVDATHFATRTGPLLNLGYAAAATLNLPVWSWGATQSKVKQAELRRNQARVEWSAAERGAIADLQSFYADAETARAQLDSLRQSAELAADSLRLTTLRYEAGEASVLEVVDAQTTLVQARNAYDDGQARYRVSLATLQTITGSF